MARLEAVEAIRSLKARYAAWADAKYTPDYRRQPPDAMRQVAWEQALCFTGDAAWHAGDSFGGSIQGRGALHEWFCRSPWRYAVHFYASPIITVHDCQHASAQWRLWQLALREASDQTVMLAGVTEESYRRGDSGEWLHQSVRFRELQLLTLNESIATLASALATR